MTHANCYLGEYVLVLVQMGAVTGSPGHLGSQTPSTPDEEHVGLLSEEGMGRGHSSTAKLG